MINDQFLAALTSERRARLMTAAQAFRLAKRARQHRAVRQKG